MEPSFIGGVRSGKRGRGAEGTMLAVLPDHTEFMALALQLYL